MSEYGNDDSDKEDIKDEWEPSKEKFKNPKIDDGWEPTINPNEFDEDSEDKWEPVDPYKDKIRKKDAESSRVRSDPRYKLNKEDRKIVSNKFAGFLNKICRILNVYKKDLPSIFGYSSSSTFRTMIQGLRKGEYLVHSLYKNLKSWYDRVLQEMEDKKLGEQNRQKFIDVYETHLNEIIKFTKKVVRQQFNYYKNEFFKNGWILITPFEEFADIVLKQDISPSQIIAIVWCGEEGHSIKRVRISSANSMEGDYKCLDCEQWEGSTKYNDLFSATGQLKLTLLKISSQAQWLKLVSKNHKKGISPSRIEIKVKCGAKHEFTTTFDRIKQAIKHGKGNGCRECADEANKLTLDEIKKRGQKYGFILNTSSKVIRNKIKRGEPLKWTCKIHGTEILSQVRVSRLEKAYCIQCSGGKITKERVVRYMLTNMFGPTKFGTDKQMYTINGLKYDEIRKNIRINSHLSQNRISKNGYRKAHLDCFDTVKIAGKDLKISVEVWGPQHKNHRKYFDMYPKAAPSDYKRLKIYDKLKKILHEKGFIDVHIIVPLYSLKNDEIQRFIIKELKRQLLEGHGITFKGHFAPLSWKNLLKDIKNAKDYRLIQP